jgi:ubiquinone/menaquinone biosynthesis C-methylase UbiE
MNVGDVRQFEWIAPLYDPFTPRPDVSTFEQGLDLAERPIERVLDVGGGTGRAARSVTAPRRIVADPAAAMLAQAREHDLETVRASGSQLPVRDASIDAVLIVDALHHISDQTGTLAEAHRVLRPGGVLVVVEFDPTTVRGRLLVASEHLIGFDSTFQPPASLRDLLAQSGFETTIPERGFVYTIVGTKAQHRQ